jgi:prepilin-type N-terminal cleavage/methylation domain-containing protein
MKTPKLKRRPHGFTFIELTVVIFLVGLALVLTVPRVRSSILADDLKKTVRRLVGTVRTLRNDAVRDQKVYGLHLDLETNRIWTESEGMTGEGQIEARDKAYEIPDGVRVVDVWRPSTGKQTAGETIIRFSKKGYIEQSVIHLADDDGRYFTLMLNPFLGRVQILEKYVDFQENS